MWSLGSGNHERQGLHGLLSLKTEQVDAPKFPGCSGAEEIVFTSIHSSWSLCPSAIDSKAFLGVKAF